VLGEVLADSDQRLCRVAALRNCLLGGSPVRRPRDSAWVCGPLRVVDWRQYQVARWWPLWVVPWRVYKPRDKVT